MAHYSLRNFSYNFLYFESEIRNSRFIEEIILYYINTQLHVVLLTFVNVKSFQSSELIPFSISVYPSCIVRRC